MDILAESRSPSAGEVTEIIYRNSTKEKLWPFCFFLLVSKLHQINIFTVTVFVCFN